MSFAAACETVHRHKSSDPFATYRPSGALVAMQAHYQERDARSDAAVAAAAAAARVVRPGSSTGGAPSGHVKSKTKPSRAPPAPAAARGSSGTRPRGRPGVLEVVMYQAMCLIAYDS